MAIRPVLTYPHPALRSKCLPVENVLDPAVQQLIDDLIETSQASGHSVGIAAPQLGELLRIVFIDCSVHVKKGGLGPLILVNPEIGEREESYSMREGCMSLPDYVGSVTRARRIMVKALDRHGQPLAFQAKKFEAIVIQHELDHLEGVLFIDRIGSLKTDLLRRQDLQRLKESKE